MKKLLLAALLLTTPVMAQPVTQYGWAPKPISAPFTAPNRAHWKLADLLKAHERQPGWSQVVVRDPTGLTATYIQSAPGEKSARIFYGDTTIFFIVQSGQLRVMIEGIEPFIASKGFVVQVPSLRPYHVETVGDAPALRFEVTQTLAPPSYVAGETPAPLPGKKYVPVGYYGTAVSYGDRKPFVDFQKEIVAGGMNGRGFVTDIGILANINRIASVPRPPDSDKGHFHIGTSEFFFILENQVDFLIEGVPFFTASQGDVVYAPAGRYHRATSGGTGYATRVSIHPVDTSFNAIEAAVPAR
jgi:mannose-6-phosphate isomerase-like protein (cupin superfamily)